jgi:hypothetical protein
MSNRMLRVAAAVASVLLMGQAVPRAATGQDLGAPRTGTLTLLSLAPGARIALKGTSAYSGPSPLEVPEGWSGRYSVVLGAPGHATGQSVIGIPTTGAPYSLSEAPGLSTGLLVRSLNFPGLPDISSGHKDRGTALLLGAGVATFGSIYSQIEHDQAIDRGTLDGYEDADDYRMYRDRWFAYGGAVWAVSALDYMVRSRVRVLESTPERMTLGVPRVTRGGMLWRSIVAPGSGQEFAGLHGRGMLWLGGMLAAGAGYVMARGEMDQRETDIHRSQQKQKLFGAFDSLGPTEQQQYLKLVNNLEQQESSLKNARAWADGFLIALASAYGLNVLDALTAPIRRDDATGPPRLSLIAPVSPRTTALGLSYRF